jgi:TetR/AcrR family transcriptional regulator, fatty acid metabolism regulator protein
LNKNKPIDRKKQAVATRQKISRVALRLFAKEGFDKVTVDDICKKAGVSHGTFYVYFNTREQVILDLFAKTDQTYDLFLANELALVGNPVEKLWLLGKKALSHTEELGVDVMQITYRARLSFSKKGDLHFTERTSIYKIVQALVKEAQASGEMRRDLDSNEIAHIILRCIGGTIDNWCLVDGNYDLLTEGEKVFGVILKGLRPGL